MNTTLRRSAEYYLNLARESAKENNSLGARMAYFMSIQAWKKAVEEYPSLSTNLIETQKEYIRFIRADSRYNQVLSEIRAVVARVPGIREEQLFRTLSKFHETDLKYTLYFAIKDGQLWSVKKEKGLEYHLPSGEKRFGLLSLLNLLCSKISTN